MLLNCFNSSCLQVFFNFAPLLLVAPFWEWICLVIKCSSIFASFFNCTTYFSCTFLWVDMPRNEGAVTYQLGNTSSRTIIEVKQHVVTGLEFLVDHPMWSLDPLKFLTATLILIAPFCLEMKCSSIFTYFFHTYAQHILIVPWEWNAL